MAKKKDTGSSMVYDDKDTPEKKEPANVKVRTDPSEKESMFPTSIREQMED